MVDRLVRDGLVERRPHPIDRRATEVHLTAAGAEVFAPLDAEERRTLGELLGRVIAAGPAGER